MEHKRVKSSIESEDESIQRVTVIGQGVMGPDIALSIALSGCHVTGVDILEEQLEKAAKKTELNCRQMIEGGILMEEMAHEAQHRITRTLDWETAVANADFVMEDVPEDMTAKQDVFARCDGLCSPEVIIASNTSSMSITQIAEKMSHPERAVTAHWTIPAHLSPLVEVVAGEQTSQATKDLTYRLLKKIGKHPVFCMDTPGFIHNFLQHGLIKAALELLENQAVSPEAIDSVVRNGFGLRLASVGPIQFLDMCGLDTVNNVSKYLYKTTGNPTYKPFKVIEEKISQGDLGVKTGKGFYEYETAGSAEFWERTNREIIRTLKALAHRSLE
jgi:3-hydroxybutyryl-CoA dehydrogenase